MLISTLSRVHPPSRRAFSLTEILVALTILGIVGAVFTRILITQGRYTDLQHALGTARMVSRQAINILESEVRMVQDSGGIDSASTDGKVIRLKVPYRFGLNCGVASSKNVVSMLPEDSLTLSQALFAGWAWRNNVGRYTTVPRGAFDEPSGPGGDSVQCTGSAATQAQIRTISIGGRSGAIQKITPVQTDAPKGQSVFFYQRITYRFGSSIAFPGRFGLYRTAQGGGETEIMAPFDTSARFRLWYQDSSVAKAYASPDLAKIRGIDIELPGQSAYTPMGKSAPSKTKIRASVFFKNVR
jgi:prepilin-type N-terminal cleavage/methylation domain-containing protein